MKRLTLLFIVIACVQLSAHSNGTDTSKFISEQTVMTDSVLRHVVLFKFKDATPAEKLKEIDNVQSSCHWQQNNCIQRSIAQYIVPV